MFPCLSATRIILDGLRLDSLRDDASERPDPPLAVEAAPARRDLFPRAWSAALARRAERRAQAVALDRLGATSPHLLADIGMTIRGEPWAPEAVASLRRLRPAGQPFLRPAATDDGLPIAAE